jgi:hypothetical protein
VTWHNERGTQYVKQQRKDAKKKETQRHGILKKDKGHENTEEHTRKYRKRDGRQEDRKNERTHGRKESRIK